jgi:hypothetical protein
VQYLFDEANGEMTPMDQMKHIREKLILNTIATPVRTYGSVFSCARTPAAIVSHVQLPCEALWKTST